MREQSRLRVFEDQAELTIEIGPVRDWFRLSRDLAGPLVFLALSVQAVRTLLLITRAGHSLLGSLCVVVFGVLAVLSASRFLWAAAGWEVIVLRGGLLTVSRRVSILTTSRTYRLRAVKDIHAAFRLTSRFRMARGRIGFRYDDRMRYMADRINSHEAKMLVKIFREWLPRDVWTPVLGL